MRRVVDRPTCGLRQEGTGRRVWLCEVLVRGLQLLHEFSDHTRDALVSMGERLSIPIVHALLEQRGFEVGRLSALDIVATDDHYGTANVDRQEMSKRLAAAMADHGDQQVVLMEGFVGRDGHGEVTTLGRGGSDLTASLVASMLGAAHMEKSTDVPGMLTADPRVVPSARIIDSMSYEEAMELCHFGAKVIYPPTLLPLREAGIPLVIRSTFDIEAKGTTVSANPDPGTGVRGVSSIDGMALVTLVGGGMVGIPGYSRRMFMALSIRQVNVVLITQGSSEHSITVAVQETEVEQALEALNEEFESDVKVGKVEPFRVERGLSILALVGDAMHHQTGLSGRAFDSLGKNGINIYAIAQGSTERNISIVIRKKDVSKALRALHSTLFEREIRRIHLFCMGVGERGRNADRPNPRRPRRPPCHAQHRFAGGGAREFPQARPERRRHRPRRLAKRPGPRRQARLARRLRGGNARPEPRKRPVRGQHRERDVAGTYEAVLGACIGVVASNKISAADTQQRYDRLNAMALAKNTQYRYETNVGAGLPVIDTIEHLVQSGDCVHRIDAVLSGTLNFLFSTFGPDCGFGGRGAGAMDAGYTEPDPRIDLSGVDVQRKILILAREAGYAMEMTDVDNPGFLPAELMDGSVQDFLDKLPTAEEGMQAKLSEAAAAGLQLRYVVDLELDANGKPTARVGLQSLPPEHPFCQLQGSDNVVMLKTDRYAVRPLIVQGQEPAPMSRPWACLRTLCASPLPVNLCAMRTMESCRVWAPCDGGQLERRV